MVGAVPVGYGPDRLRAWPGSPPRSGPDRQSNVVSVPKRGVGTARANRPPRRPGTIARNPHDGEILRLALRRRSARLWPNRCSCSPTPPSSAGSARPRSAASALPARRSPRSSVSRSSRVRHHGRCRPPDRRGPPAGSDPPVLLVVALQQPVAGVVFVLDGVLIGAGDQSYLAVAGLIGLAVFLPLVAVVWAFHSGLVALWLAYSLWLATRFATLTLRARAPGWLVTGACAAHPQIRRTADPRAGGRGSPPRSGAPAAVRAPRHPLPRGQGSPGRGENLEARSAFGRRGPVRDDSIRTCVRMRSANPPPMKSRGSPARSTTLRLRIPAR